MNPLVLRAQEDDPILGVNCIDINPAHHLLAFGIDGRASVQFWDLRSRSIVGVLDLPRGRIARSTGRARVALPGVDDKTSTDSLAVTAIAAGSDGLSYAIGTSTGHTLLYDIRSPRPFAFKDQGYGLPLKNVAWLEGGSRMAGDGIVLSADKKVVKIWDRNTVGSTLCIVLYAHDLSSRRRILYPSLQPLTSTTFITYQGAVCSSLPMKASKWDRIISLSLVQHPVGRASLKTLRRKWRTKVCGTCTKTTNSSRGTSYGRTFSCPVTHVCRVDPLALVHSLGLDHLIGTPALKPYMHGYFVSLKLYETARVIANPFAYAEHREKLVKERLEKLADTRIRTRKEGAARSVGVNKALAERIERNAERERRREEKKRARKAKKATEDGADVTDEAMPVDEEEVGGEEQLTLLNDPRFKELFENSEFTVDETSREYALLNPSSVAMKNANSSRGKTAVEDEEDESDKVSSDGLGGSGDESSEDDGDSDDSSDAGGGYRGNTFISVY